MKVSIVIPVFNAEKYLKECIDSALNQTYKDIEIIAVDDGSTDSSPEILKKYENKITTISKKNGGTASALNAGIKVMSGAGVVNQRLWGKEGIEILETDRTRVGFNQFLILLQINEIRLRGPV